MELMTEPETGLEENDDAYLTPDQTIRLAALNQAVKIFAGSPRPFNPAQVVQHAKCFEAYLQGVFDNENEGEST